MNVLQTLGAIAAIVFIFIVYTVGNNLDRLGDYQQSKYKILETQAETEKENVILRRDILKYETERQKLLGTDKSLKDIDAEYTIPEEEK